MCDFKYNDGGRSNHFKGTARDCVTRAIAIATERDYKEVYDELNELSKEMNPKIINSKRYRGKSSSRNGIHKKVYHKYILDQGFEWVSKMKIGSGCTTHLHKDELPGGIIIARLSKHLTCVIDGVINDTYNPQRGGVVGMKDGVKYSKKETRCVYGYYIKSNYSEL